MPVVARASVIVSPAKTDDHPVVDGVAKLRGEMSSSLAVVRVSDAELPFNGDYRRIAFDRFFRNSRLDSSGICVSREGGVLNILFTIYFFVYQFLNVLEQGRHGRSDESLLRENALRIVNNCAQGDYNSLYDMIYN